MRLLVGLSVAALLLAPLTAPVAAQPSGPNPALQSLIKPFPLLPGKFTAARDEGTNEQWDRQWRLNVDSLPGFDAPQYFVKGDSIIAAERKPWKRTSEITDANGGRSEWSITTPDGRRFLLTVAMTLADAARHEYLLAVHLTKADSSIGK